MDIYDQLHREHSKFNTTKIVNFVGKDPQRFDELMTVFFKGPYRITQRAAWPMSYCVENHPPLVMPYLSRLIGQLSLPTPVAVKRNVLRLLQNIQLPRPLWGKTVTSCFDLLASTKEPIAVKVFAMTVIYNISIHEMELRKELKILLEDQWPNGSPGFRSRADKILKKLENLN